jgi:hypothetical protein
VWVSFSAGCWPRVVPCAGAAEPGVRSCPTMDWPRR